MLHPHGHSEEGPHDYRDIGDDSAKKVSQPGLLRFEGPHASRLHSLWKETIP